MSLREAVLDLSRQAARGPLSPWLDERLDAQIASGVFLPEAALEQVAERLTGELSDYRAQAGVGTAVLGMSGGVDSALTAALLKRAGWRVVGLTLPIEQNPDETERGFEACEALGLEHLHLDLTAQYREMVAGLGALDPAVAEGDAEGHRTRRGNVRARLRMITLYDQAHRLGGLVTSTDNFSELAAGFWTLHGDVGDLAPVQSLLKSWEVPWMARHLGVPERIWRAKPTDGLGIGAGDEAQIGATYLEFDILVAAIIEALMREPALDESDLADALAIGSDDHARAALRNTLQRLRGTWYKRVSPIQLDHPLVERFSVLDVLDARLFRPAVLRADQALSQFGGELPLLAHRLLGVAAARGIKIATAESCTAGLVAACLAAAPGSSRTLEGSFVSYCASMKSGVLGVDEDLLARETAYHPDVARAMAEGALARAPAAGLALSVTGVAGPAPDEGRPPGLVYVGAALRGGTVEVEEHRFEGRPRDVLAAAVAAALSLGLRVVEG